LCGTSAVGIVPAHWVTREEKSAEGVKFTDFPQSTENFLIILATPAQYADITALLQEIDVQPLQVYLSLLIAEVEIEDTELFSLESTFLGQEQVSIGGESDSLSSLFSLQFPSVESLGGNFQYAILAPGRLLLRLQALASQNRVKVLSTPRLFVRNNRKARIFIGSVTSVPEVEQLDQDTDKVTTQYKDQETGIMLAVIPKIHHDTINLEIVQEVSRTSFLSYARTGQTALDKRQLRTSLDLEPGMPLVLGGYISELQTDMEGGIPLLKDIPILGKLFKSTYTATHKSELLVIITAKIVATPADKAALTNEIYKSWLTPEHPDFETQDQKVKRILRNLSHPAATQENPSKKPQ